MQLAAYYFRDFLKYIISYNREKKLNNGRITRSNNLSALIVAVEFSQMKLTLVI
jgi:hypothetical protein